MKKVLLTESEFRKVSSVLYSNYDSIIKESFASMDEEYTNYREYGIEIPKMYLIEGIIYNPQKKTVRYSKYTGKDVDTESNEIFVDKKTIKGITIYSVFKRSRDTESDGNPLIYALKGESGWKFQDENNKNEFLSRLDTKVSIISKNFLDKDTTVLTPSSRNLNKLLGNLLKKNLNHITLLDDVVRKMTIGEVYKYILEDDSEFRKNYKDFRLSRAYKDFLLYCKKSIDGYTEEVDMMEEPFKLHFIDDATMRSYITKTLKVETNDDYFDKLDGKNVIIIDDTVYSGNSIRQMIREIKTCYKPKSISVLTLFSKSNAPQRIK